MSIDATRWAWKKDCSSPVQKIVLLSLADRANEQNYCYPSFDRLMKDTGSSRSSIIRSLLALEGLGFIARIHRKNDKGDNTSNAYQLIGVENREGKVVMAYDVGGSVTVTLGGCHSDTRGWCHSDTGGSVTVTPKSTSLNLPSIEPTKETHAKGEQTATAEEQTATASAFAVCVSESFQSLWESSPLPKSGKQKAAKAWAKACKGRPLEKIAEGMQLLAQDLAERAAYVEGYDSPFWKTHLSTYINGQMWKDEDMPQRFGKVRGASGSVEGQLNEAQAR